MPPGLVTIPLVRVSALRLALPGDGWGRGAGLTATVDAEGWSCAAVARDGGQAVEFRPAAPAEIEGGWSAVLTVTGIALPDVPGVLPWRSWKARASTARRRRSGPSPPR
jgi:hypothetical protein